MKLVLRGRQSGVGLKPPQAAVVKINGGERCGNVGTGFRQARLREASASKPLQKWRNRISWGPTIEIDHEASAARPERRILVKINTAKPTSRSFQPI